MMSEIKAFTAGFEPRSIGPTLDPPPPQQAQKMTMMIMIGLMKYLSGQPERSGKIRKI